MDMRDDFGRMNVTGNPADRYLFRTTPLRNVELTAPYGHDGSIATLRGFVEHYSESDLKLQSFDPSQLEPDLRNTFLANSDAILAQRDTLLNGVVMTPELVDNLVAYLESLTDPAARDLSDVVPRSVPSGLPVGQASTEPPEHRGPPHHPEPPHHGGPPHHNGNSGPHRHG
jgi:cytochrome c peroxidase